MDAFISANTLARLANLAALITLGGFVAFLWRRLNRRARTIDALERQVNALETERNAIKAERDEQRGKAELYFSALPESRIDEADAELRQGNEELAWRVLQTWFDEEGPRIAEIGRRLADWYLGFVVGEHAAPALERAEHYARFALLANPTDREQQALIESIERHQDIFEPATSTIEPNWADEYCPIQDRHASTRALATLNNKAKSLQDEGHYRLALALSRRAVRILERLRLIDTPENIIVRRQFGALLRLNGQFEEAVNYLSSLAGRAKSQLGTDDSRTLQVRNSLGVALSQKGDLDAAEDEHKTVLEIQTRVRGPEHPDTLVSWHNLAQVHECKGDFDAAEDEHKTVLEIQTRVLGPEQPHTLMSRYNLAVLRQDKGDLDAAEDEHKAVLAIRSRTLGPEHPDTLESRHRLAALRQDKGDLDAAEAEFNEVLTIRNRTLGAEDPDTIKTRDILDTLRQNKPSE